jgi:predicted nucleic acid-binding protein
LTEPFAAVPLVLDSSAWTRAGDVAARDRWKATVRADLLVSCPVAALEMLAAARDEDAFVALARSFDELPQAPVTASVCRAALGAARDLHGRRRLPAADYLIAAAAAERGFGVLHHDRHFDLLAGVLDFPSVWLR